MLSFIPAISLSLRKDDIIENVIAEKINLNEEITWTVGNVPSQKRESENVEGRERENVEEREREREREVNQLDKTQGLSRTFHNLGWIVLY